MLTSSRHPLRSGETVVRLGGGMGPARQAFPDSRPRKWRVAGLRPRGSSAGTLAHSYSDVRARPDRRPEGAAGRGGLTYLSRSAETYPLSDVRGISVGTRRVPPAPGRPRGAAPWEEYA